jgi:hypothetical protein
MRPAAFLILFALAACGHVEALALKNSATGEVRAACGPYTGLATAVAEAQKDCAEAWAGQGWTPAR